MAGKWTITSLMTFYQNFFRKSSYREPTLNNLDFMIVAIL